MGLQINTNKQSLFAQKALRNNTRALQSNVEKLSSGFRINSASDDAAGFSISNKLTTELRGLEKAVQNAGDGISMIQTAEGGLTVIQENLQRIRELVVQGEGDIYAASEKSSLQREINERVSIINSIAAATQFNGHALLLNASDKVLQTGDKVSQTTTVALSPGANPFTGVDIDITSSADGTSADYGQLVEGTSLGFALDRIHLSGSTVNSQGHNSHGVNFAASVSDVDQMIDNISRIRSYLGATQNSLESQLDYLDIAIQSSESSRSRVRDVDMAKESSILVKNQILQQSASAMLTQANAAPEAVLQLLPR